MSEAKKERIHLEGGSEREYLEGLNDKPVTTTPTEILEQLREMREFSPTFVVEDEIYVQVLQSDFEKLLGIMEAIVEMPEKPKYTQVERHVNFVEGSNAHRAEVLAKIAEGLGKK